MRKKIFRFHILLFTFISLWSQAQVIRVAPTPSGSGNGSSWANASSLQNAIAIASSNSQIWVKQGDYPVSSTLLVSLSNISIYGGFAGDETALNQRDWTNNTTVFNGQNTVKIMRFSSNNGIIDGIHFRNGFVTGTVYTTNDGGGALRLTGVDQIIRNCTFLNNRSTSERGGGAIFIWHGGGQLIENCIFQNNTQTIPNSNGGGAIHNWDENVIIRNCRFVSNNSSSTGGAVYSWGQNFRLEGSTFENNHSDVDGGAVSARYYSNTIINCNFIGNTANGNGGALINSDVTKVINCLFNNNEANGFGGAIYNNQELEVTNSTFVNNNNTAIGHSRFPTDQFSTYLTSIYNSIFYGNTPKAADYFSDISPSTGINSNDGSEKDIRRNIVQEYNLGTNNMIGVNPQFVNNTNNFTLQTSSPAINAGNNTLYNQVSPTNATASTDLNGNPRLFGIAVDYGAYELQQIITPSVPACTAATIPANGATNIDIATNFSWTAVTGATSYTLQIGTTSGTWDILNQNVGNVTTFDLPNNLNYSTQYFVRIIPSNSAGQASGCSVTNFTTQAQPITVPACTSATIPANGATNIGIATNFSWTAVTGATSYTLQIGTASGTWNILNQNVGNVTTFDLPNNLNYSTQYFVRIIPSNSAGPASGCSVTNFITVYGDEDGDGVTDDKDQCPNTPLGIPVDSNGCPVCSEPLMTTINIQENDAEISISGGISPFNYRVDNGLWQSISSNSIVLNDLEGGLHTIEINSADTCETILEFSIIEMHNVITPNGDGINDILDLSTLLLKEEPKLIIVDRYSNKIFEGNANNQFIWDGKLNGRPIKTDSYWFYMQWKEPNSQTPSKKQGWILVKNR